jgi:hypothetical protein
MEISKGRKHIYEKIKNKFQEVSIPSVKYTFLLYDEIFFSGGIVQQLKHLKRCVKILIVNDGKAIDILFDQKKGIYYFNVNGVLIEEEDNTWISLQKYMEDQLIHLIMMLWNHNDPNIYKCMLAKYFGIPSESQTDLTFGSENGSFQRNDLWRGAPNGVMKSYTYNSNSCYIDSLLTILLFSDLGTKDILLNSDINKFDYENTKLIHTSKKPSYYAQKLREIMSEDINILQGNNEASCSNIRSVIYELLPSIKNRNAWTMQNVADIYSLIGDLYPPIKMDIPQTIIGGKKESIKIVKESMVTMWDFMDPLDDVEDIYKKILWESINSKFLIFYNGGTPRIKNFNNLSSEQKVGSGSLHKQRCFGEKILNDRYALYGVISLHGVNSYGGGRHYVSYFKKDNKWYFYDDIEAVIHNIKELPTKGLWTESNGIMPSMYFYKRIGGDNYKRQDRPDGNTLFFVKTGNKKIGGISPISKVKGDVYMWRIPTRFADYFEKNLKYSRSASTRLVGDE